MSRVAGASTGARATAADVKALADTLAVEAEISNPRCGSSSPTFRPPDSPIVAFAALKAGADPTCQRRGNPQSGGEYAVARRPPALSFVRLCFRVATDALYRFDADDGWAIASHIALSALMAMFPFLIVVTALAGFIGSEDLADEVARLLIGAWPKEVSGPIAGEIHSVLTTARGDVLTVGVCSRSISPRAASRACASA